MKIYQGRRKRHVIVTVDGCPLQPRLDLRNHSPSGFEWGYGGSGPAHLALAILADHLGDDEEAQNLYQRFKWQVIAELPYKRWTLTSEEVEQAIQAIHAQQSATGGAS